MTKVKVVHTTPLMDYYGTQVNVGDIILGALGGGRYHKTQFTHAIVVGRTAHMVEVHSLGPWMNMPDAEILAGIKHRGHRGGRVHPAEVIRLDNMFTQVEIDTAMLNAKSTSFHSKYKPKAPKVVKRTYGIPPLTPFLP